jgi:hypothetical protein
MCRRGECLEGVGLAVLAGETLKTLDRSQEGFGVLGDVGFMLSLPFEPFKIQKVWLGKVLDGKK